MQPHSELKSFEWRTANGPDGVPAEKLAGGINTFALTASFSTLILSILAQLLESSALNVFSIALFFSTFTAWGLAVAAGEASSRSRVAQMLALSMIGMSLLVILDQYMLP